MKYMGTDIEYDPNDYKIPDTPDKWRMLCFRLTARIKRVKVWKKLQKDAKIKSAASKFLKEENKMVKEAIKEMEDNCMKDDEFVKAYGGN